MRKACGILTALFVLCSVCGAAAGEMLSVRLVYASDRPGGSDKGLEDVVDLLKRTIVLKHYLLRDSSSAALPADKTLALGDYAVRCRGEAGDMRIEVFRGRKRLLKTNVTLKRGKPLVLGGLPAAGEQEGREILIFLVKKR
ncbi:MAG: hypothetical protein R6V03_05870 [Kiritimatiellia bacterium]